VKKSCEDDDKGGNVEIEKVEKKEDEGGDDVLRLLYLPEELLEVLGKYLDVTTTLALASTCSLLQLYTRPRFWRSLLRRVRRMDRSMVARLTTFLLNKGLSDEEEEQPEEQLFDLHFNICSRFPPTTSNKVTVVCSRQPTPQAISSEGFQLLARAGGWILFQIKTVRMSNSCGISGRLLTLLHFWTANQVQSEGIARLHTAKITCTTREEAKACVSLLQCCRKWYVERLELSNDWWERLPGLGKAAPRGRISLVDGGKSLLAVKEYRTAVKAIWAVTEAVWWVDGEMIVRDGREEEGWRELEGILDKK